MRKRDAKGSSEISADNESDFAKSMRFIDVFARAFRLFACHLMHNRLQIECGKHILFSKRWRMKGLVTCSTWKDQCREFYDSKFHKVTKSPLVGRKDPSTLQVQAGVCRLKDQVQGGLQPSGLWIARTLSTYNRAAHAFDTA